ncbi:MAG: sugar porter family MFS transporter [Pirellulales bacterium]|nr:sugar porter family MFS transporter [Pirellulales bacterium]
MTLRRPLIVSAAVSALGGFLFGFDTVVISGAEQHLASVFAPATGLSPWWSQFWHGFLMASALIGTVVGSICVGKPADSIGRRGVMFWLAILYFISAIGSALAWDWYSLFVFRFIGGLGVGGASVVSPMYIAEISPAKMRGRLVALAQFNIVFGILMAYVSNFAIHKLDLGEHEWRWMFGVEAIPAALYFALLFITPRSPRWLVAQRRDAEAEQVLRLVGVDSADESVEQEVQAIRRSIDLEHHELDEPFFQAKYSQPIRLAFAIAAFNQLSGINAILYYAPRIFKAAGYADANAALMNSIGLGIVNLIFTILGLALIDHYGRRKLMLAGSIGYILSLGAVAWAFYTQQTPDGFTSVGSRTVLVGLLAFLASHAVGQGAVIWVFIGEIFPNRVRARGQAFGSFTHWIFAAAISQSFPLIAEQSGAHVFLFYALCMVGQLVWVVLRMPETKGVPLEEIQQRLHIE